MSTFTDAERDAQDLAKLVNEDTDVTTRYGDNPKKSFPKVTREINDEAENQRAYIESLATEQREDIYENATPYTVGNFTDGFTYTALNQRGEHNGDQYVFLGGLDGLPYPVPAGTDPTLSPNLYAKANYNDATSVANANGGSVQDALNSIPFSVTTKNLNKFSPKKALFSWQFDGSYIDNYTTLLPAVEAKGIRVGLGAIVTQTVGAHRASSTSSSFFTIDQLKDAYDRGHEVINHGWDSGQDMKPGNIVADYIRDTWINESFDVWLKHGISTPIWITPNGGGVLDQTSHLDTAYIPYILEKHAVVQGRTDFPHQDGTEKENLTFGADTPLNEVGLVRCGTESYINTSGVEVNNPDTQLALLKDIVDYAIANNRSVVFAHHNISNGKFPLSYVEQLIDYVIAQGGEWASNSDVFSSFSNALNQGVYYKTNKEKIERYHVDENLLKTTQFDKFDFINNAVGVGYTLTELSLDRSQSSQYTLSLTGLTDGSGVSLGSILNRPFDTFDAGSLTASIGVDASSDGVLTLEIVIEAYDDIDASQGAGNLIGSESTGEITINTISNNILEIPLTFRNFFSLPTCQSIQVLYRVLGNGVAASASAFLFNPTLNRGSEKARFQKTYLKSELDTRERETLWSGSATTGTHSLSRGIENLEVVEIEITGSSSTTRLGTKTLVFTSPSTTNREVVWFWGGSTVANARIIFDNSNSFRIDNLDNSVITDAVVRKLSVIKP